MNLINKPNTYTQREKMEINSNLPYDYNNFPENFRYKLFYLFSDVINFIDSLVVSEIGKVILFNKDFTDEGLEKMFWVALRDNIVRLYGMPNLFEKTERPQESVEKYILKCKGTELLDLIELFIGIYLRIAANFNLQLKYKDNITGIIEAFIKEVNNIFAEYNLGYELITVGKDYQVVKIGQSPFLYEEVIKKSLILLQNNDFKDELSLFRQSVGLYKGNKFRTLINSLTETIEMTLKRVLARKKLLPAESRDLTINDLLEIAREKSLFPEAFRDDFGCLVKSLAKLKKEGATDNKSGTFALHLTGSFILFLLEA